MCRVLRKTFYTHTHMLFLYTRYLIYMSSYAYYLTCIHACYLYIHTVIFNFLLHEVSGIVIPRQVEWLIWGHKQIKDWEIPTQVDLSNPLHITMQPASWHKKPPEGLVFAGYCSLYWVWEFNTYLFYICIKKAFPNTNLVSAKIHSSIRLNKSAPLIRIHKRLLLLLFLLN